MIRLFTGIALPDRHRQHLTAMMHGLKGARWVAAENLHVTLRFIGEVDEDVARDVDAALAAVEAAPFELSITGVGTFGRPPRVLWAGAESAPETALAHLYAGVESALVRSGQDPEGRKFSPHITLARFKDEPRMGHLSLFLEGHARFALPPFTVEGFNLMRSRLSPGGAHYEAVAEYELKA